MVGSSTGSNPSITEIMGPHNKPQNPSNPLAPLVDPSRGLVGQTFDNNYTLLSVMCEDSIKDERVYHVSCADQTSNTAVYAKEYTLTGIPDALKESRRRNIRKFAKRRNILSCVNRGGKKIIIYDLAPISADNDGGQVTVAADGNEDGPSNEEDAPPPEKTNTDTKEDDDRDSQEEQQDVSDDKKKPLPSRRRNRQRRRHRGKPLNGDHPNALDSTTGATPTPVNTSVNTSVHPDSDLTMVINDRTDDEEEYDSDDSADYLNGGMQNALVMSILEDNFIQDLELARALSLSELTNPVGEELDDQEVSNRDALIDEPLDEDLQVALEMSWKEESIRAAQSGRL